MIKVITITQARRRYHWRTDNRLPIKPKLIQAQNANMHIIPANSGVESALKSTRKRNFVQISEKLVEAMERNKTIMKSSLVRNDAGAGDCEVIS